MSQQPLRLPVSALKETTGERWPSNPTRPTRWRTEYKPALIKEWRSAKGSEDSDVPQVAGSIPWEHANRSDVFLECAVDKMQNMKEHNRCGSEMHLTSCDLSSREFPEDSLGRDGL